jgi:hypothetical protein
MWNISTVWVARQQTMQELHVKLNPGLPWQKQHSEGQRLFSSKLELNLKQKLVKCYILSVAFCGAETWTLRKLDQSYGVSFEMWCWRSVEKISWTDCVRNEEVLHRVKQERNILYTVKRGKADCIGSILHRNYLLKHDSEGKLGGGI